MNTIYKAILQSIWFIFIEGPLKLSSYISNVINFISTDLLNTTFENNKEKIEVIFKNICIASIMFASVLFIINFIYYISKDELQFKQKIISSIKNTLFSVFFIIFIPQIIIVLGVVSSVLINLVFMLFSSNNNNISSILFHIGDSNYNWNNITNINDFSCPDNISDYNFFIEIAAVTITVWSLLFVTLSMTGKIIEIVCFYIISPFVSVSLNFDNGDRLRKWKSYMISNYIEISVLMFNLNLFLLLLNSMTNISQGLNFTEKQIFIFIFLLAGSMFIIQSNKITSLIGGGYSYSNSKQSMISGFNLIRNIHSNTVSGFNKLKNVIGFGNGIGEIVYDEEKGKYKNTYKPTGIIKKFGSVTKGSIKFFTNLGSLGKAIFKPNDLSNKITNKHIVENIKRPLSGIKNIFKSNDSVNDKQFIFKNNIKNLKREILILNDDIVSLNKTNNISSKQENIIKKKEKVLYKLNNKYVYNVKNYNKNYTNDKIDLEVI